VQLLKLTEDLDSGGVEHLIRIKASSTKAYHTEASTEAARRQSIAKLGANGARIAMDTGNLADDASALAAILISLLGTINKSNTLAQIPYGFFGAVYVLELKKRRLGRLRVLSALVAQVTRFYV